QPSPGPAAPPHRPPRPARCAPTQASASPSPPRSPRRHRPMLRPFRFPAPSAASPSGPASAAPGAASSSGPSLGDLLHPRHAAVEAAHDLAHERIILWTRRTLRGFGCIVLAQPVVDLRVVAQPRAHMRYQLGRLLLRLLVMKPVSEPQNQQSSVHLGLRVEIHGAHSAIQLLQYFRPPRHRDREWFVLPNRWGRR